MSFRVPSTGPSRRFRNALCGAALAGALLPGALALAQETPAGRATPIPLTIAHLLEHTSGFDELGFREYGFASGDGGLSGALAVNPTPRESRWPPGDWMAYNNGGYAVAARAVEVARGRPFDEVVRTEVLEPLGMAASGLALEAVDSARLARHFLAPDQEEPAAPYPMIVRPADGLITSADDLAALVHMLLRRGEPILSAGSIERMETPSTSRAARAGLEVGYGLGIYGEMSRGFRWLGHAGGTPSAWARYAYLPDAGVGYVVLMNSADGTTRRRLERALRDFLVPPAGADPPASSSVGAPERATVARALAGYAGIYRPTAPAWSLTGGVARILGARRVHVADGQLVLEAFPAGTPDTLTALGGDRFTTGYGGAADVVFLRGEGKDDGDGPVTAFVAWDADNVRAGNLVRSSAVAAWTPLLALGLSLLILLGRFSSPRSEASSPACVASGEQPRRGRTASRR